MDETLSLAEAIALLRAVTHEQDALKAVVDALPRCAGNGWEPCTRPATWWSELNEDGWCDKHYEEDDECEELPYAAALRALKKRKKRSARRKVAAMADRKLTAQGVVAALRGAGEDSWRTGPRGYRVERLGADVRVSVGGLGNGNELTHLHRYADVLRGAGFNAQVMGYVVIVSPSPPPEPHRTQETR